MTTMHAFRARTPRVLRAVMAVAILTAPLVALAPEVAQAATSCDSGVRTEVWDGGASTNSWDDAANWSPDVVPGTGDHVCINTGSGVTVADATVASLESTTPLSINGTLTLTSTTQGSRLGATDLAGTLTGAGARTLTGTLTWSGGGVLGGPGITTVAPGATLDLPAGCTGHRFLEGPLVNQGTFSDGGSECGYVLLLGDGSIDNAGSITLDEAASIHNYFGTNSIHNEPGATITHTGAAGADIDVALDNDGTVTAAAGTLTVDSISGYDAGTHTLSGGVWAATGSGSLDFPNVDGVAVADATFVRDGASAQILDGSSLDPLRTLTTVTTDGGVTLRNGPTLTTPGPLTTAGAVRVGAGSALTSTGLYRQVAGSTTLEDATATLAATGSRVDVEGGTLFGKGHVTSEVRALGGTINPNVGNVTTGGTGILAVTGPGSLDATSGLAVRINGITAGGSGAGQGYPQLTTSGALTLGGTLRLSKGPDYTPTDGATFTLATGSSRTGSFANITSDASFAGWNFTAANTATQARVTIHHVTGPDVVITAAPTTAAFADGSPGTWTATVSNAGGAATSGTITATLTLGAGQTFGSVIGSGWACSGTGTVTCTRANAIPSGASAPAITLTTTATGVSSTTLAAHVAGGGDAVTTDNDFTATVPVMVLVVPVARISPGGPTTGVAPLTVSFDAATSTCSVSCTYRWDFGDGSTATGLNPSHTFTTPGTYSVTLLATNDVLTDVAALTVTALAVPPLQANAGDDRTVPPAVALTLDGRASVPGSGIGYDWDFGDASAHGSGATPSHTYAACSCDRTVTLTVTRGTETATDTSVVHVVANPGAGLAITVDDGSSPIAGADVVIIDASGTRYPGTTDGIGVATLTGLADGGYTAFAWKSGYLPQKIAVTVDNGHGAATVSLASGSVAATTLEARRLTYDEIVAAGIDPNDPANQNVIEFQICLAFGDASCASSPVVTGITNGDGEIIGGEVSGVPGGSCTSTTCSFALPDGREVTGSITVEHGQPQGVFIILQGKAHWLKEFFEVKMVVANLAPSGFAFVDGSATLDIPKGLTLAPTANPQAATQTVADVDGGGQGSATWLLRGDDEGSYPLTVHYAGTLDPIGKSLSLSATTEKDLRVWGLSAMKIEVAADTEAVTHDPYRVRVRLTNVTDTATDPADQTPIYNPAVAIDKAAEGSNFIFQPGQRFEQGVDELAPGESFDAEYVLIPNFTLPLNLGGSLVSRTHAEGAGQEGVVPTVSGLTPQTAASLTAHSTGTTALTWDAIPGASQYIVYRTTTDLTGFPSPPVPIRTVDASGSGPQTTSVGGLATEAWYAISTVDGAGDATMHHELAHADPVTACSGVCTDLAATNLTGTIKPQGPASALTLTVKNLSNAGVTITQADIAATVTVDGTPVGSVGSGVSVTAKSALVKPNKTTTFKVNWTPTAATVAGIQAGQTVTVNGCTAIASDPQPANDCRALSTPLPPVSATAITTALPVVKHTTVKSTVKLTIKNNGVSALAPFRPSNSSMTITVGGNPSGTVVAPTTAASSLAATKTKIYSYVWNHPALPAGTVFTVTSCAVVANNTVADPCVVTTGTVVT